MDLNILTTQEFLFFFSNLIRNQDVKDIPSVQLVIAICNRKRLDCAQIQGNGPDKHGAEQ